MARLKRSSTVLETARQRVAGIKTITPTPNFGDALDLEQYDLDITAFSASLDRYNDALTLLDRQQNDLNAQEKRLREKNVRVLAAIGALYGPNSNEYETAGGTRSSEHKRSTKKGPGNNNNT